MAPTSVVPDPERDRKRLEWPWVCQSELSPSLFVRLLTLYNYCDDYVLCELRQPPPSLSISNQLLCLNMLSFVYLSPVLKRPELAKHCIQILSNRNPNVKIFDFLKFFNYFIFKCLPKVKHIPTNNLFIHRLSLRQCTHFSP